MQLDFNAVYDEDNPRFITKCEHHFHLSCILEWMERSDICPICDKVHILLSLQNIVESNCEYEYLLT